MLVHRSAQEVLRFCSGQILDCPNSSTQLPSIREDGVVFQIPLVAHKLNIRAHRETNSCRAREALY